MLAKNIKSVIKSKLNDWAKNVNNEEIKTIIKNKTMVTGGVIVSMLLNEEVNDFDIYLRDKESVKKIAQYYCDLTNSGGGIRNKNARVVENENNIKIIIQSCGVIEDEIEEDEFYIEPSIDYKEVKEKTSDYRPVYITDNAITLKSDIQIVLRFYGEPEEIHKNYDFIHCTCCYSSWNEHLELPQKALESILTKELVYSGSLYPLCSIIRTRKFIKRGWSINAGQYVKMALQLQDIDLKDFNNFKEQSIGVDSAYFTQMISLMTDEQKKGKLESSYLMELINKIF